MPDGGESGAAMTAKSQAEAVARNDALFRNANERINEVARSFDPDDGRCSPSCASAPTSARRSCGSAPENTSSCGGTRPASRRCRATRAAILGAGRRGGRYATVEKLGAARVAVELDRRAGGRS